MSLRSRKLPQLEKFYSFFFNFTHLESLNFVMKKIKLLEYFWSTKVILFKILFEFLINFFNFIFSCGVFNTLHANYYVWFVFNIVVIFFQTTIAYNLIFTLISKFCLKCFSVIRIKKTSSKDDTYRYRTYRLNFIYKNTGNFYPKQVY